MSKGRHTDAEIIAALKQVETGRKAEEVAREVGVSKHAAFGEHYIATTHGYNPVMHVACHFRNKAQNASIHS